MYRTIIFSFALLLSMIAVSEGQAGPAKGEVVFLRGIFGVFSTGLNEMSDSLGRKGVSSKVYHHDNWRKAARDIIASKSKRSAGRIVVVGHSLGANAAIRLSKHLKKSGIKVEFLVTLDPTIKQSIPGNVRRTVNYYLPQSIWGTKVLLSKNSKGRLTNIQLSTTDDFGHFIMDNDSQLKNAILSGIRDALKGRTPRLKRHRNTIQRSSFVFSDWLSNLFSGPKKHSSWLERITFL